MSTLATALEIPDSSDDEAARLPAYKPKAGDTATGKADAPLPISDSDDSQDDEPTARARQNLQNALKRPTQQDDAAPAAKRQRTDDAPVDLTKDSSDDEAARPGSPDTDGSPNARAFWPGIPEKGDEDDDFLNAKPAPQRKPGPAQLSQFFAPRAPPARGTKPPGLLRLGVRRGGGPDPKGTRSLSEEKFVELLRREEIAVVCDMRSGRGAETCGRKLKNPSRWEPCGISPPKFMCQCSIAAACKRGGAEYQWVGAPRNTRAKDRGKNLGGSRVALRDTGAPAKKVSGEMRRAYLDPTNTAGRSCLDEDKKRYPHPVVFDPESYRNLQEIGTLSKRKRVALLCVEDELAICHCKVLLDIMLRDRMVDAAVAIEPESLVPGAGWANVRCDCSRDWKAELDARKAARRK